MYVTEKIVHAKRCNTPAQNPSSAFAFERPSVNSAPKVIKYDRFKVSQWFFYLNYFMFSRTLSPSSFHVVSDIPKKSRVTPLFIWLFSEAVNSVQNLTCSRTQIFIQLITWYQLILLTFKQSITMRGKKEIWMTLNVAWLLV